MANPELKKVSLSEIVPHPDNPRVVIREDVVAAIAACLEGEYPAKHAVHVRPVGEQFQLLSGHQRTEAARRKGFAEIWAWVEEMDDQAAFMELVTSNNQGELSPLEIGIHALKLPKEQGKKGKGLSAYAERIGKHEQNVRKYRDAAEVFQSLTSNNIIGSSFLDKTFQLCAISKLPRDCWQSACEWLATNAAPVADVESRVSQAFEYGKAPAADNYFGKWLPVHRCMVAVFCGADPNNFHKLSALASKVANNIDETEKELLAAIKADKSRTPKERAVACESVESSIVTINRAWSNWLQENSEGDSWNIAKVQAHRVKIEEMLWNLQQKPPADKADLILADPPWQYDFAETDNRQIENQYPTASVEEICEHVNAKWFPPLAENCVLYLWATAPKLREALRVMESWGFEYKSTAVWDKVKIGMGYWWRGQHEFLLVGTRGSMSPPEPSLRVPSVFREEREGHSVKPECVYQAIESMFPNALKCEVYQRTRREGWKGYGNES